MEIFSMKLEKTAGSCAAFAIGIAQMYLLLFSWAYVAANSPLPSWLIARGVRGFGLSALLWITDFIISVCFCLPAAYLLLKLRPRNLWWHLTLAVIPAFLWQYRLLLSGQPLALSFTSFVPGMFSQLLMLPTAVFVLSHLATSVRPNNSFKPKPLRGSA
jgi:hypothetical protein